MSKDKESFIKRPALVAGIFITVVLVVAFISVFWSESERNASFLNWVQNINQDTIAEARAFKHRTTSESDQIVITLSDDSEKKELASLFGRVEKVNVYEAPPVSDGSYVLDMTEISVPVQNSDKGSEVLLNVTNDGKLYFTFDKAAERAFCSKGNTWWIDFPELASYISNIVSHRGAQVNVIAAMKDIKSSDFVNPSELGNVSPKKLAGVLRRAAKEDKFLALSDAEALGETDTKWFWEIVPAIEGDPENGITGNDMHFRIRCGLIENIVEIAFGQAGAYDTVKLEDEDLYNLIRRSKDYKIVVKKGAYNKYKEYLIPQIQKTLDTTTADFGSITDYKVTRFVKVWDYKDGDGSTVKLYDFKYALIPDEPEKLVIAGGMYLDSKARIHGVDAGQFAVREKNGKIISTAFMGSDFYYAPASGSKTFTKDIEERKAAKSRINSALVLAEKAA